MKNSVGYVYGNPRDPAHHAEITLRLGISWPPTLYCYVSTFNPDYRGIYAIFGLLVVGVRWGRWITQQ